MSKAKRGRPALGTAARSELVAVRFRNVEHACIESLVESWNAGLPAGALPLTAAGWIRDVALESLRDKASPP